MVVLLLPVSDATARLLTVYDNAICVVFLIDFFGNLFRAPTKKEYFIGQRGWLDLLGSIPTLGTFKFTALFRLARSYVRARRSSWRPASPVRSSGESRTSAVTSSWSSR